MQQCKEAIAVVELCACNAIQEIRSEKHKFHRIMKFHKVPELFPNRKVQTEQLCPDPPWLRSSVFCLYVVVLSSCRYNVIVVILVNVINQRCRWPVVLSP